MSLQTTTINVIHACPKCQEARSSGSMHFGKERERVRSVFCSESRQLLLVTRLQESNNFSLFCNGSNFMQSLHHHGGGSENIWYFCTNSYSLS